MFKKLNKTNYKEIEMIVMKNFFDSVSTAG